MLFLSQLINGLQLGSIYALVALGYSMVYGIIMLLNFAHGDIIMMGGYFALVSLAASSNPVLAVIATVVGCVVLAVVIEKVAYKPLRQAPPYLPADHSHRRVPPPPESGAADLDRQHPGLPQHHDHPGRYL